MAEKKKDVTESTEIVVVEVTEELLREKLYEVRGVKVMLDSDLAEIYGYTTKALNQQVKNNNDRFDSEFTFKLTQEEWKDLRSKNLTSSWGGSRHLPNVFTEQGVYMLMTVLKGELAAKQDRYRSGYFGDGGTHRSTLHAVKAGTGDKDPFGASDGQSGCDRCPL